MIPSQEEKSVVPSLVQSMKKSILFQNLADEIVQALALKAKPRRFGQNEILIAEGADGEEIFLLLAGTARTEIALSNADSSMRPVTLQEGDVAGADALVEGGRRFATTTAASDVETLVWKAQDWRAICEADPRAGYEILRFMARDLVEKLRKMHVAIVDETQWGLV